MKFKYKQASLLILLTTMGIGILTLSVTPRNSKPDPAADAAITGPVTPEPENTATAAFTAGASVTITPTSDPVPTPTLIPVPTVSPTPAPLTVYPLEKDGYPKIKALMKDYYDAKLHYDLDKLKTILSDPADVPTKKQLSAELMYIEEYQNIKCYVKKSYEKNCYIVYVYNDIKFMNIKTPAPAVDRFYVITDEQGNLKVFSGTLDSKTKEYYDDRLKDDDVAKLLSESNSKGEKARASDEMLKAFWDKLAELQKNGD
jgi:hypothetical protein